MLKKMFKKKLVNSVKVFLKNVSLKNVLTLVVCVAKSLVFGFDSTCLVVLLSVILSVLLKIFKKNLVKKISKYLKKNKRLNSLI